MALIRRLALKEKATITNSEDNIENLQILVSLVDLDEEQELEGEHLSQVSQRLI